MRVNIFTLLTNIALILQGNKLNPKIASFFSLVSLFPLIRLQTAAIIKADQVLCKRRPSLFCFDRTEIFIYFLITCSCVYLSGTRYYLLFYISSLFYSLLPVFKRIYRFLFTTRPVISKKTLKKPLINTIYNSQFNLQNKTPEPNIELSLLNISDNLIPQKSSPKKSIFGEPVISKPFPIQHVKDTGLEELFGKIKVTSSTIDSIKLPLNSRLYGNNIVAFRLLTFALITRSITTIIELQMGNILALDISFVFLLVCSLFFVFNSRFSLIKVSQLLI